MNLTPDNLVTLYTSAYLNGRGLDRQTRGPEMEVLIQQVSTFANDWRIKRMDVTIRGDITVALEQTSTATHIINAQYIKIEATEGAIYVPTGPVVEYSIVNHQKYSLRCNPPLDMDLVEITEYLHSIGVKVKELIIQTDHKADLPCGGIQIYAGFTD